MSFTNVYTMTLKFSSRIQCMSTYGKIHVFNKSKADVFLFEVAWQQCINIQSLKALECLVYPIIINGLAFFYVTSSCKYVVILQTSHMTYVNNILHWIDLWIDNFLLLLEAPCSNLHKTYEQTILWPIWMLFLKAVAFKSWPLS